MKNDIYGDLTDDIEEESAPFWMISFSDMATLLLTFFIMLYSFSSMNTGKAEAVSTAFQQQFGSGSTLRLFLSPEGKGEKNRPAPEVLPSKSLPIRMPPAKNISGVVLFEQDSHELGETAKEEIREIIPLLNIHENPIEIRGHAGPGERGSFRDAMDLGYARAYNVRSYLIDQGIVAGRIQVYSVGDSQPARDEENKPLHSCVEIYVVANPT